MASGKQTAVETFKDVRKLSPLDGRYVYMGIAWQASKASPLDPPYSQSIPTTLI